MTSWRLEQYPELGSTSDEIIRRAQAGEPAGLAVLAFRQTAGRGSRGRSWVAPQGNLNLSLLLRPERPARDAGLFSLMAGLAVVEALTALGAQDLSLKWPNDILHHGAKLAGILIDAAPQGEGLAWLALGIGVNLRSAPQIAGRQTTDLSQQGLEITPPQAAWAILARLKVWQEATGSEITQAWLAHGHKPGTSLEILYAGQQILGLFAGLSPRGELLLQREDRIETLNTGEILRAER